MILWTNVADVKIEDQSGVGSVMLAITKKNTMMTLTKPLGEPLPVLELGIQNVNSTSKNMKALKTMCIIMETFGEEIDWR